MQLGERACSSLSPTRGPRAARGRAASTRASGHPPARGRPREPRLRPEDPRATQLLPAAPGSVGSGCPTRTSCRPPAAVIVRRAPPTSTARAAPAPAPGLRAPQLRAPGGRGRGGSGCACGEDARLLIPAGGGSGADARTGLAVAGRGPSHQRWRGAEGRAEQAGWVGSGLRVAMAASTPGRAPLARGGAAQSGRRPRPRPARQPSAARSSLRPRRPRRLQAGEREVKAGEPLPGLGPAPRQGAGEPQRRAARAAGTAGEPQPPPASAPAPCEPAHPAPAPLRPGGRCAQGLPAASALPGPASPPPIRALLGPAARAGLDARPPPGLNAGGAGESAEPAGTRQSRRCGRKRDEGAGDERPGDTASRWRRIGQDRDSASRACGRSRGSPARVPTS
ncbi:hypothetical protein R6Z07F_010111 [Ovis aries]